MAKEHFHCPVNGWDCPHYSKGKQDDCLCTLKDPYHECDDFYAVFGDDCDPYDYTDYEDEEEENGI